MNKQYACFLGLLAVCFSALSSTTVSAQDSKIRSDLSRSFTKFDLVHPEAAPAGNGVRRIRVQAEGRQHQLVVTPNDMFAATYIAEDSSSFGPRRLEKPAVNTYKGTIAGEGASEVRLTIDGDGIQGFFDVGSERFFVEPARRYSDAATAAQSVIYKEEASLNTETFYCRRRPARQDRGRRNNAESRHGPSHSGFTESGGCDRRRSSIRHASWRSGGGKCQYCQHFEHGRRHLR